MVKILLVLLEKASSEMSVWVQEPKKVLFLLPAISGLKFHILEEMASLIICPRGDICRQNFNNLTVPLKQGIIASTNF